MFVSLDKAIMSRLTGGQRDNFGNPRSGSGPGLRIPFLERPYTNDPRTQEFSPFRVVANRYVSIPIYKTDITAVDFKRVYPSVSYDFISFNPRMDQWLPPMGRNRIDMAPVGADTVVRDAAGNVVASGKATNVNRPLPESYDVMVQFDIYSRIQFEAYSVLRSLVLLFPQKGAISVPQADGSSHVCDMLMQGNVQNTSGEPDLEEPGGTQGAYREHRLTLTYVVEAYLDTTWPVFVEQAPAITGVTLEMADVDNTEVLEVKDLTKLM